MAIIINPYTVPSFFAGIISLILGLYAMYKNPKERITQVFFVMMLGCSIWSLIPLFMQAQTNTEDALFWAKLSNAGLLIIPVTLFHFSFLFQRKRAIEFKKIVWIYLLAAIMIILLLSTNLFFTMADDPLIDGDGANSRGRGTGKFSEEEYSKLPQDSMNLFYFIDTNNDDHYTVENETIEPLQYNQIILVGFNESNTTWEPLKNASNNKWIWYVDSDQSGDYTLGESIYLENFDRDQKLVYNYIQGPLYYLLILFFFGFIMAAIINLILKFSKTKENSKKKPFLYLIIGLIAIVIFILTQSLLAWIFAIPVVILDSAIALIISLFFTVAVLKYDIIDLKLIIRKSMFYSTASIIIVVCFVVVEEGMEFIFAEIAFSGSILSGIIAAIVALILFSIIKKGLRNQIDKFFPSVKYLDKEYQNRSNAYKATLIAMLTDGRISKKEKSAIDILRDHLDITSIEHKKILSEVKSEIGLKRPIEFI
jgi:hypothetical protein